MTEELDVGELELTDAEVITILKNHGLSRRVLMKAAGVGAGVAALSGTAAANSRSGTRIDDVYGAPFARGDNVPTGILDHVVDLNHLHADADEDEHDGFPSAEDEDEFIFDPVGLHVKPGDVVHFNNLAHEHTVSAFHDKWAPIFPKRVPDNVPGFTSPPFVGEESWLYRFTTKGVYDIFCFPHIPFGMAMRVVVYDPEEDDIGDGKFDGYGEFTPPGPFGNIERVLADSVLSPENIVEEGKVAWAELFASD